MPFDSRARAVQRSRTDAGGRRRARPRRHGKAGKKGGSELKDLAKEFPALTASAQFLGMEGVVAVSDLAAALEVARKGAADGTQAANHMANFMRKLTTKETITSTNSS